MRGSTRLMRRILGVVLLAAGLFGGGCASDRQVIAQADQAHNSLEPAVITDPELNGYIQDVGDRIIQAAAEYAREKGGPKGENSRWMFDADTMRFHFVNSKTLNAFTTGGEHMYIYTQLFREADSEDELAAVMAHEFAHVYGRHVHKGMNRQIGLMGLALGAGAAGYAAGGSERGAQYGGMAAGLAATAGQFVGMSYTRQDEAEADKLGYEFYVRAGWDPEKFDDFFQHMIDKGLDTTPALLSDHPTLKSRVDAARRRTANLGPRAREWRREPVASAAEFRRLQDRSAAVGERMPNDQTLASSQLLLQAMPRSCFTPLDDHLSDQKQARNRLSTLIRQNQQRAGR